MASYTYEEKGKLLSTPIEAVLYRFGKDTSHDRSNLYLSPFREERTRSFHVDPRKNVWYDFGLGQGGGILDLVRRLAGCSQEESFDILAGMDTSFLPSCANCSPSPAGKVPERTMVIDRVSPVFRRHGLIRFAARRGITKETLDRYCVQVTYHTVHSPQYSRTAIGFANESGGYVLRSESVKKCSSSGITLLRCSDPEGRRTVSVFEGFFDFLSWIEDQGIMDLPCDVCVLNSVANWRRAVTFLCEHEEILLYLDNDKAGMETAGQIRCFCVNEKTRAADMSHTYEGYKDYNEMLTGRCSTHKTHSYGNGIIKGSPEKTGQDQLG